MGLPWRSIGVLSLLAAYLAGPRWATSGRAVLPLCSVFAVSCAAQCLVWLAYRVILYPKLLSPLRHLPEPKNESFFMGQWYRIRREPACAPMLDWINSVPNDGLIRYLGIFNQERLLVTSPKTLAEVLVAKSYDFQKPSLLRLSLGRVLGSDGILFTEGDQHKAQRRKLMPAFTFRHTKDLYPVFWDKARECVQAMTGQVGRDGDDDDESGQAVLEALGWASRVTLDIIGVAGLGRDFDAVRNPNNELIQTYRRLFDNSDGLFSNLGLLLPNWFTSRLSTKHNRAMGDARTRIRAVCADLVRAKKEKLARLERSDVDILSVALESGAFTDENLLDQAMIFLAAGHETTAAALTWAVYLLCRHPAMQTRLRAEVRARLPPLDAAAPVTALDIERMPYLRAVCNEVLRYYGPVPMTVRDAARDTSIAGHFVPRGTRIILSVWAVNKSPELWGPDAMRFDPERWMSRDGGSDGGGGGGDENDADDNMVDEKGNAARGGATSNYAFMTFLHGPRSCIGAGFARAEFACLLAAWVGRFEFELADPAELDEANMVIRSSVTARPAKGLRVKTRVVEGW